MKLKLDFEGLSLQKLQAYRTLFTTTSSQLKAGLFPAMSAAGVHASLDMLGDFHGQVTDHIHYCEAEIKKLDIQIDVTGGDSTVESDEA